MNPTLTPAHLIHFREHFRLTQAQAAAHLSVSRVTWNRWESGHHTIPAHLIHTLRAVVQDLKAQALKDAEANAERAALGL